MNSIIDVYSSVVANESKYSQADVDSVDIDEDGIPEHLTIHPPQKKADHSL